MSGREANDDISTWSLLTCPRQSPGTDTLGMQVRGEAGGDLVHTLRWSQKPTLTKQSWLAEAAKMPGHARRFPISPTYSSPLLEALSSGPASVSLDSRMSTSAFPKLPCLHEAPEILAASLIGSVLKLLLDLKRFFFIALF